VPDHGVIMSKQMEVNSLERDTAVAILFPDDHEAWSNPDHPDYITRTRMEIGLEDNHPAIEALMKYKANILS
jgi:hypothetical protein